MFDVTESDEGQVIDSFEQISPQRGFVNILRQRDNRALDI